MTISTPNFYAIIPANVRYCKNLEPGAKLLYGEITALASQEGYCWATNRYLSSLYDVEEKTIQRWLGSLKKENFIVTEVETGGYQTIRKIWISPEIKKSFTGGQKCRGPQKVIVTPDDKNVLQINTVSNTLNKGTPIPSFEGSDKSVSKNNLKKERAPFIKTTDAQDQNLLAKAGCPELLKQWYEFFSNWKIGKSIGDRANDYAGILRWVIQAVEEKNNTPKPIDKIKENAMLASKIESLLNGNTSVCVGPDYIEFIHGPRHVTHIKFKDHGFKEQVFNEMRKFKLHDAIKSIMIGK